MCTAYLVQLRNVPPIVSKRY